MPNPPPRTRRQPSRAWKNKRAPPPPISTASPNKRTRSQRLQDNSSVEDTVIEQNRLYKVFKLFEFEKKKPCSLFGLDRQTRPEYKDYFFCGQCHSADTDERCSPDLKVNRLRKKGPYTCIANHTNLVRPTHRMAVESSAKKYRRKKKRRNNTKKGDTNSEAFDNPLPTSRFNPTSLSDNLYLSDIEEDDDDNGSTGENSVISPAPEAVMSDPPQQLFDETSTEPSSRCIDNTSGTTQSPQIESSSPRSQKKNSPIPQVDSVDPPNESNNEPRDEPMPQATPGSQIRTDDKSPITTTIEGQTPSTSSMPHDSQENSPIPQVDSFDPPANESNSEPQDEPMPQALPDPQVHGQTTLTSSTDTEIASEVARLRRQLFLSKNRAAELARDMKKLKEKLKKTEEKVAHSESHCDNCRAKKLPDSCFTQENADDIVSFMKELIIKSTSTIRSAQSRSSKYFFEQLAELILDESIHEGQLRQCSYSVFRNFVRENIFTPYRVLKAMDQRGGVLNYEGIEILRVAETQGVPNQKTLLPSSTCLQVYAAMVEAFGRTVCPFVMKRNPKDGSEGFSFRAADVLVCLLKAGKVLDSEALLRPIYIAQSLDGALFTKHLSHTLCRIKFNDRSNPFAQSREGVFPVACVSQPESTPIVLGTFARTLQEIKQAAIKILVKVYGIKPLKLLTNCDMNCDWKLGGRGGAAKQVKFPCAKCAIQSGQLHQSSQKPIDCSICKQIHHHLDPEWVCMHTKICTEEVVQTLKSEVDEFKKSMPLLAKDMDLLEEESEISTEDDPRSDPPSDVQLTNLRSIHFDLGRATQQQRREYSKLVTADLSLRRLPTLGRLEDRQRRLKAQHYAEWEYRKAKTTLDGLESSRKSTALVLIMDSIPCLLHLENRMGIKMLTMVLKSGLSNAILPTHGELPWMPDTMPTVEERIQLFKDKIADIMNRQILGTETQPTQWEVPYEKTTKKIGDICMDNVRIRRCNSKFHLLIDACIVRPEKIESWKRGMEYYKSALAKVNVRDEMTDEQIFSFQKDVDYWYREWLSLYGEEGITNYAHMLGSGHLCEYLLHWRNLWIHSQQGWEGKVKLQYRPCV